MPESSTYGVSGIRGRLRIDFNALPDAALLRAGDFLKPGPVPLGRTAWAAMVAAGKAPAPVVKRPRFTVWKWADVRQFLEGLAAGGA